MFLTNDCTKKRTFDIISTKANTYCCELLISGVSTYSKLADRERLLIGGKGGFALLCVLRVLLLWHLCITYIVLIFVFTIKHENIVSLVWSSVFRYFVTFSALA